jgi:hypothetical protein
MKLDIPDKITKYLVNTNHERYLSYLFGLYGFYVESVKPIKTTGSVVNRPSLVTVRYYDDFQLKDLASLNDNQICLIRTIRVFKSECLKLENKDKIDRFIYSCAKNALHLVNAKDMLYIDCKDNKALQKRFYDIFARVNKEEKTNIEFDYDQFDVKFTIKEFIDEKAGTYWLLTFIDGLPEA